MKSKQPNLSRLEAQHERYTALQERFLRVLFLGQWGALGDEVLQLVQTQHGQADNDDDGEASLIVERWVETCSTMTTLSWMREDLKNYAVHDDPESFEVTFQDVDNYMLDCLDNLNEIEKIIPDAPIDYDKVFLLIEKKRSEMNEPITSDEIEDWYERGDFDDEDEAYEAIENMRASQRSDLLVFEELIKREQINAVVEPERKRAKSRSAHKI